MRVWKPDLMPLPVHFTDEETEGQRGPESCPRVHSSLEVSGACSRLFTSHTMLPACVILPPPLSPAISTWKTQIGLKQLKNQVSGRSFWPPSARNNGSPICHSPSRVTNLPTPPFMTPGAQHCARLIMCVAPPWAHPARHGFKTPVYG
jgi:hypothetical protein